MHSHFSHTKPVLLIVMDGWGIGSGGAEDAIAQADTPYIDQLWQHYPHTSLLTHGPYVGLSTVKDLGGSEVGHCTMGAGRIIDQGPTRIQKAIEDGSFYQSDALNKTIAHCVQHHSTLHLLGLLSDGNIHSHIDHIMVLIEYAAQQGITRLRLHTLFDGRDVGIQTAQDYVQQVEACCDRVHHAHPDWDYRIASGGGREVITMDRDHDWRKVKAGWQAHVHGVAEYYFPSAQAAIASFRSENPELIDQDMPGFVVVDEKNHAVGTMQDHDAVIMVNFRGDRAIEISEAFCMDEFDGFDRGVRPDVLYAGMMVYHEDRNLPPLQIMGAAHVQHPFGERILRLGIRQFRLTETQKYPHITFFFNGGRQEPLDADMEDYILIPSDQGISFADVPKMQAKRIADRAVALIASGQYGFGLINFANADMVGHCGKMEPAMRAVEVVDAAVGRIIEALKQSGGCALIVADHGNADEMRVHGAHGEEPSTRHSLNPVPCILFDPEYDHSYHLRQPDVHIDDPNITPGLSHLAATLFQMLGMEAPDDLNPSLIES